MFKSKYSTVLTILLIIIIVAIIIIATILAVGVYKEYQEEKERKKIYASLQGANQIITNNVVNNTVVENEAVQNDVVINTLPDNNVPNNTTQGNTTGNSAGRPTTTFFNNYPMVGYIKIPKTGAEYPILSDVTPGALEVGVGVLYPSNPKLNEKGNVVIIGHNYRNNKFFANNDKLVMGDKIQVTDLNGKTLTYKIYEISILPETDTEYITRERGENIEISLSTCTDDGNARLVILARAE